jgi:hypothetical protein
MTATRKLTEHDKQVIASRPAPSPETARRLIVLLLQHLDKARAS